MPRFKLTNDAENETQPDVVGEVQSQISRRRSRRHDDWWCAEDWPKSDIGQDKRKQNRILMGGSLVRFEKNVTLT